MIKAFEQRIEAERSLSLSLSKNQGSLFITIPKESQGHLLLLAVRITEVQLSNTTSEGTKLKKINSVLSGLPTANE